MNDVVVAYESFSTTGRTQRSGAIPYVSPESGAQRPSAAPGSLPVVSGSAAALQIPRAGGARIGDGFAHIRLNIERAWQAIMRFDSREAMAIAELIEQQASRLSVTVTKTLHGEIAALRAVALVRSEEHTSELQSP